MSNINPKLKLLLQVTIIAFCAIFISSQIGKLSTGSASDPVPMADLSEHEDLTDECMDNLDAIGELLAENSTRGIESFFSPIHPEGYLIVYDGDKVTVSDPSPELHGFKKMSVSSENPELEIVY